MKKTINKILISILASAMLVTSLQYKPVIAESAENLNSLQEIELRANELSENLMNLKMLTASNIGGFVKGSCAFRSVISFGKLGLSVLKLSGVFGRQGEDWRITAIKNINNRLNAVDAELGNINKHLDQIEKSINEQLSAIDKDVKKISTTLAKNNMTDVALVAKQITDKIDSYENVLTSNLISWYELDDSPKKINISYLTNVENGESKTVYIPKDLIENTLAHAKDWDVDRKEELIKNVFIDMVKAVLEESPLVHTTTYNDFNNYCLTVVGKGIEVLKLPENSVEFNAVLNQFSEAAYDTLRYECTKKIAKAKVDNANTYASTLVGLFTTYCNYLTEANNVYISPLKSQYDIYSNIYAFQGELKTEIIYSEDGQEYIDRTNLASLAREKYFIELNIIGAFVVEIANASGAYTKEDLHNAICLPWSTSEAALNQAYNEFYHTDLNGNEIDNFCYVTDSVLKYGINCVDFCMNVGLLTYETSGKRHVDSTTRKITTDWTSTIDNDYILTNNQLSKIYAYFAGNVGKRSGVNFDFYDYLFNYKVCDTKIDETYDKSPLLITSFNGGTDMGSNDKITMIAWPFYHEYNEKYIRQSCGATYEQVNEKGDSDNYTTKFYKEVVTGSTGEMVFKRKGVANTFNPLTGEANTNTTVGAAAMHFHDYKTQDDIAMLVSAEYMPTRYMFKNPYSGPNDTAFNYNVSSAQLWKKSWSGNYISDPSKGQERLYAINSRRHYGSIISNDVDVYITNGKISNTNSIEAVQNNSIKLANDYIKNASFTDGKYLINNVIKEDTTINPVFENVVNNTKEKFVNLLETLYPGKTEEIEKLRDNKVFSVSFDNDKSTNVDIDTYKAIVLKLIDYLKPNTDGNNANITSMINEFRNLLSEINKTIDVLKAENNKSEIVLSDEDYTKLIKTIITEDLEKEFAIYEMKKDLPSIQDKPFIYCEEDGEIYLWDINHYVKYGDSKETRTYLQKPEEGTVIVSDDIYTSDIVPNDFHGDYIYNSTDHIYYKWNEVVIPEHYGDYQAITKIKAVNSIPSEKVADYLYNSTNNKVYEWKRELQSQYVMLNDIPIVENLETYVGQLVKCKGDYYKWVTTTEVEESIEAIVDKYIPIDHVDTLPETKTKQYLVCGGNCYKWSTIETNEKYVEIDKVPQVGDVVKVESMPTDYKARFILLNDTFYQFVEKPYDGETSKYKVATETIKKFDELQEITTDPIYPVEVNIYPSSTSRQLKLVYEVKPTISFELFFDKEIKKASDVEGANIAYKVVPYFDITPMLTWKDAGGNQKYLKISDDVIKRANIRSISVKIPVLQMNNERDTNALIYHFDSMDHTSCPIDEYYARIITENGAKYAMISSKSFSPFMVKMTYSDVDPSKKYAVPNTNIN